VSVQGRLAHSGWKTESGERRERHEVVANSVTFLGQRPAQAAEATEEVRAA
jgi:single-stranded DNA-binding protein